MAEPKHPPVYGLMAEFEDPNQLVAAAHRAREAGYRRIDAYSPLPIEELHEAIGFHDSKLPLIVLIGGIIGCVAGYLLQYWVSTTAYPLNVGGKPLNSWPAFIPITFEMTVLCAAFAAVLGMLGLNGLPQPYHPLFNIKSFAEHASRDRFFIAIEYVDPKFNLDETRKFLESLGPKEVIEVPR
jgi:hypothetical protein